MRRSGDGGFGDTQALEQLARAAAERGVDALAISPMHAMFSAYTEHFSPYSSASPVDSMALRSARSPRMQPGEAYKLLRNRRLDGE